ncbi:hypothetical protein KA005_21305, partial [bacterium]|nr:hypothetical protein [bacterium]
MKLYAQHGHAPSDKMHRALEEGFINGVILSPRYLAPDSSNQMIAELKELHDGTDVLIDPEFYATRYAGMPNAQLGYLEEWSHFLPRRQNEFLIGTTAVDDSLRASYEMQMEIGCTRIIAPNIYVTNSFDSIEAAIAISFINRAKPIADEMGIEVPVYATLAVCRDAVVDQQNFMTFLNTITAVEPFTEGVYSMIGAGPTDE